MKLVKFLLAILIFGSQVQAQKVLKLDDAVSIALQKNTLFLKSENNLRSFEASAKSAYGSLLPSLSGDIGWRWNRSAGTTSTTAGDIDYSLDSRSYSAGVGGSWVLFDGLSNYANLSRTENNLEAAKLNFKKLKQDIVFQTISAYYNVLSAKKLLDVKQDDLKWNQKNFEIIQERNKLGSVTKADVYAQQVRLGSAELEVIRSQNNYETVKSNFFYSLGIDVFEDYVLEDISEEAMNAEMNEESVTALKLIDLVEKALLNRTDYQGSKLSLLSANESVRIAKAGHLPSLRNTYSAGFSADKPGDLFKNKNYSFGLTLDIPIFQGWNIDRQVELAEIDKMNAELDLKDMEREIKRDLQKSYLDLQASEKSLEVGKSNVLAAGENRKIEEEKYLLGATTLLNVLIANSEYTNALTGYITAQFDYLQLKDEVQYQLGLLEINKYDKK